MQRSMVVCQCHRVSDARVEQVLSAGAGGVRGVVRATRAGTGCGGCIPLLRELCASVSVECDLSRDTALAG